MPDQIDHCVALEIELKESICTLIMVMLKQSAPDYVLNLISSGNFRAFEARENACVQIQAAPEGI